MYFLPYMFSNFTVEHKTRFKIGDQMEKIENYFKKNDKFYDLEIFLHDN